jgi:ABC-2 type transport system ATP-binding protein
MKDIVVEVNKLRKAYGDLVAVDDISFNVQKGEIFGLLGPNGAGKTTTFECLEGLRKPNRGSFKLMGVSPNYNYSNLRNTIGVQLQTSGLPDSMCVNEAMNFFSAYHNVPSRYDLLERLGLKEKMGVQYHTLSTGLQRRLALALAIAHKPPILFLDEPTAGLDVQSRVEFHNMIKELQENGTTILFATHDMAEAEKIANRVAILLKGKIVTIGTPREITATGAGLTKISVRVEGSNLSKLNIKFPGVTQFKSIDEYTIYYSTNIGLTVSALIEYISKQKDELIDLRVERPSLEDRFLEITNTKTKK